MNIGIIGSGLITQVALTIFERMENVKCTAMFYRSQDIEGAKLTQAKFEIDNIYDDIDSFLADKSFDVVYVAVINRGHYQYARKALLARKNVICEKAFTSNYAEAQSLARIAREQQCLLFGATRLRFQKNFQYIKNNINALGDMKLIICNYSQYSRRYDKYLQNEVLPAFDPALSGGALYDINVYNVHFVVSLFGEPQTVTYYPNKGFNGIDTSGVLILNYLDFKAICCAAKDSASDPFITIQGTKGHIDIKSMPSQVDNVQFTIGDQIEKINLNTYDDAMENEFNEIFKLISENNQELVNNYLEEILSAMKVLDLARKSSKIEFSADLESINNYSE